MKLLIASIFPLFIMSGCSGGEKASCDNQTAAELIANNVRSEAKKILVNLGAPGIGGPQFNEGTIDDILKSFEPHLASVRSIGESSRANKKLCEGNLTFNYPVELKKYANRGANENNILLMGMILSGTKDFGVYAAKAGMTYSEGTIGDPVKYSVQPTDDGEQLYVEFGKVDRLIGWISQFSSAALMGQRAVISSALDSPVPPKVDVTESCVSEKGTKFHSNYGEDTLITSDAIDEWTRQCKSGG